MLAATPAFTGPMMAPALRAAAVQSSSVTMKESVWQSKKAIPFLKVPPKLDGEAGPPCVRGQDLGPGAAAAQRVGGGAGGT